jgi:hypothetical protein
MRRSESGKTVYLNLNVYYNEKRDRIHLTVGNGEGFRSTVSRDPKSKRFHPNLFHKLARCLKQAGAPHPEM